MHYWVYVHVCPNGKRYVGCTTRVKPELRWAEGNGYRGQLFGRAILKYGWDNITHEAWELTCKSEMYYAEKYLIAYYHTTEREYGYNNSVGGEKSALGYRHSEEARKKISEDSKRKWTDPEYRRKLSEALKKVHSDPEYRKKQSETVKKSLLDPEVRRKMSESHKGRTFSEEHKKHLAEANRRTANDPERIRKIAESLKGKPKPKIKIKLPDGTIIEIPKSLLTRHYINRGKKFEYVS